MHVSISKLLRSGPNAAYAIAAYYTKGITMRELALDSGTVMAMVDYYVQAEHAEHGGPFARYWGTGLEQLGLLEGSEVDPKALVNLLQGLDPYGLKLPSNNGKGASIAMYDVTFSEPKDISALWLLGDDNFRSQIESITDEAASAAMAWAQPYAAAVRRGTDGELVRGAGGLIGFDVDHTTARPVDGRAAPHLHRHYGIMNLAQGSDGKWTALDASFLFDIQKTMAEISNEVIRRRTSELLGVTWERDGRGIPRIVGFDANLRNRLSLRQSQILDHALEEGLDPERRGEWVKAQRSSREGKNSCGDDPDAAQWAIEMLAEEGITFETVMSGLLAESRIIELTNEQTQLDRAWLTANPDYTPPTDDEGSKAQWRRHTESLLEDAPLLEGLDGVLSVADRRSAVGAYKEPLTQDQIAHEVMLEVGRAHSTWRYKNLIEALTRANVPVALAENYAREFMDSEHAVALWGLDDDPELDVRIRKADQTRYATTETLEKERKLVEAARLGLKKLEPLITKEQLDAVLLTLATRELRPKTITPDSDQYDLIEAIAFGGNEIQIAEGQAGSGKSAAVEALTTMYLAGYLGEIPTEKNHFRLIGCTLTTNAAEVLTRQSGIPADSLAMLTTRLRSGSYTLEEGAIVVIDEVSQASTAHLYELFEAIQAVKGRLVLLGDTRQLQAVEAGGLVITMLEEVPEAVVFLDETRRQERLEERAVLAALHYRGHLGNPQYQRAVRALEKQGVDATFIDTLISGGLPAVAKWYQDNGAVAVHETVEDAISAVGTQYWDEITRPDNTDTVADTAIVMAGSNPEVDMLNAAIIAEAVKRGLLDGTDVIEFGRREFLRHQRVTLRNVDWKLDVRNGWQGTVEGVEDVTVYKFTYDTPCPWAIERERASKTKVGEFDEIWFSKESVTKQQDRASASLESSQNALAKYRSHKTQDPEILTSHKASVKKAKAWLAWANALPAEGGAVPLKVTARGKALRHEEQLVVKLDNELTRYLPAKYVKEHVEGGYAMTAQRAQGATVNVGILYNLMSYVGMSRGRRENISHLVVAPLDKQIVELDRTALTDTYEWLASQLGATEARELRATNAARGAKDTTQIKKELGNLTISLATTTDALTDQLVSEIAASFILGEHRVAVARDARMTHGLNEAIAAKIRRLSLGREAISMSTDTLYQGKNALALSSKALLLNYTSPYWATQQQIESFGGSIKADQLEHGVEVVFPDPDAPEGWGKHTVFNADQAVGIPGRFAKPAAPVSELEKRAMDAAGEYPIYFQKAAGSSWAKGMPVVLSRGEVEGLEHNRAYTLEVVTKDKQEGKNILGIKGDDGKIIWLSGPDIKKLDPAFAITARQVREGYSADKFIAVASGLNLEDLDALTRQSSSVEVVLPDPDLTGDLAWQNHVSDTMNEHLTLDSQTAWDSRSALDLLATRKGEEVGLEALQAEVKATAKMIDEVREFADKPRDLARRDIERGKIDIGKALKSAKKRVTEAEDEQERMSALLAVEEAQRALTLVEERYQKVIGKLPDSDPSVQQELEKSAEFHSHDLQRMEDAEKILKRFVKERVTAAHKNPAAYTPAIDESLPLKEAYAQQHERIAAIEFYRLKYNVKDPKKALGPKPEEPGVKLDDYMEMVRVLGIEEVTRAVGIEAVDEDMLSQMGYDEEYYNNIEQEHGY